MKNILKWVSFTIINLLSSIVIVFTILIAIFRDDNRCGPSLHMEPTWLPFLFMGALFLINFLIVIKYPKTFKKVFITYSVLGTILILLWWMALASLATVKCKGSDAVIKATFSQIRYEINIYYDANHNYGESVTGTAGCLQGSMFPHITDLINGATKTSLSKEKKSKVILTCNSNGKEYAMSASLPSGQGFWCIDSKNISRLLTNHLGENVSCPSN